MICKTKSRTGFIATGITISLLSSMSSVSAGNEVNIYSYRTPGLIEPLIKAFENKTGIKANVINAKGLVERIKAEGANSPADVLLTVDIGRLDAAKKADVTQNYISEVIKASVPAKFRDSDGAWTGVTLRGRVVLASKERFTDDLITYADLAEFSNKGKVCTRSGQHVYNIGLFAAQLAHNGEEETKKWLSGLKTNLARKPEGNDRAQAKAIFEGICDLSISNTYYMGLMLTNDAKPEQKNWAAAVKVIYPDQAGKGTHVNVAGVALIKSAPNVDHAKKFIDFLSSEEGQKLYAERVHEFPVNPDVAWSDVVSSFTPINVKFDNLSMDIIAANRKRASELVDEVGFNN